MGGGPSGGRSGQTPWDGLADLAERIAVPQLGELASIMRLAGEQTTTIADTLRARSAALRNAIAENEHSEANAAGERMWISASLLAVVYLLMLAAPGVLRLIVSQQAAPTRHGSGNVPHQGPTEGDTKDEPAARGIRHRGDHARHDPGACHQR